MITRHKISRQVAEELDGSYANYENLKRKMLKILGRGGNINLGYLKNKPKYISTYILTANKDFDRLVAFLDEHVEIGIRHFQKEFQQKGRFRIESWGVDYTFDINESSGYKSLFEWWQLVNVALIIRHNAYLDDLLSLVDKCIEDSPADPFWKTSIDLMLMCLRRLDLQKSILEDISSIARSGVVTFHGVGGTGLVQSDESSALLQRMWLPVMELYFLAHMGEQGEFNSKLEQHLLTKKQWIIENNEEDNSGYWVDFPLLACCAYAHDRGLNVTVESDYIPAHVYRGEFS